MQKLLSLINPAGFFTAEAETRVKPVSNNRGAIVHSKTTTRTATRARSTSKIIALSETKIWWLSMSLVMINLVLFVSYLFSVNSQANTGYQIKKLQTHIAEQTTENKKLMVKQSEANSIAVVQDSLAQAKFVPITAQDLMFVKVTQLSQR